MPPFLSENLAIAVEFIDIEIAQKAILPEPWPDLIASGFHPDLADRAFAHFAYCQKHDFSYNAAIVLTEIGNGFVRPFNRNFFEPQRDDEFFGLKRSALDAIEELAAFYGDRISAVIWNSLAHLAARSEPEVEKSILKEAADGSLPYHYAIVDSALHATGLVYPFLLHVNSVMFAHTSRILIHNCDCGCSLVNLEAIGGEIRYELPRENIIKASQSVLTHFLAETVKLMELFLPFSYSITPEAREIADMM